MCDDYETHVDRPLDPEVSCIWTEYLINQCETKKIVFSSQKGYQIVSSWTAAAGGGVDYVRATVLWWEVCN